MNEFALPDLGSLKSTTNTHSIKLFMEYSECISVECAVLCSRACGVLDHPTDDLREWHDQHLVLNGFES